MAINAQMAVRGSGEESLESKTLALTLTGAEGQLLEQHAAWPMIARIPVTLAVNIPLRGLRVRNLLGLRCGQTIESRWAATEDVPLKVGSLHICWGEFEVVEQQMALRLTRLA